MSETHLSLEGKRLLIAGGGTGGHIYPGLAVAEEWTRRGGSVVFAGAPGNLESRIVPEAGYAFYPINVHGFTRGRGATDRLKAFKALALLMTFAPVRQAIASIRACQADVVLGCGGYVSGPVLVAGRLCKKPTMLLQLDAVPGIANRWAGSFVSRIGVALPEFGAHFRRQDRVRHVGNPVRSAIISASREEGAHEFGLNPDCQTVLVFGGSLGSKTINEAFVRSVRYLAAQPGWVEGRQFVHITGRSYPFSLPSAEAVERGIRLICMEYCKQLPLALAAADLVICRAGATTIAELTARGVASVLIPWAGAANNHQEANARSLEIHGASRVILDRELDRGALEEAMGDLLNDPLKLQAMARASRALGVPDAACRVTNELTCLI